MATKCPACGRATSHVFRCDHCGDIRCSLARCPGTNERDPGDGSTPFTDNGTLPCDPDQVPLGP